MPEILSSWSFGLLLFDFAFYVFRYSAYCPENTDLNHRLAVCNPVQ